MMQNERQNRLMIRKIRPEEIRKISERNTTVRLDEYLASLPKDVILKIMQDQAAVLELIERLKRTLDAEYICVYGVFLEDDLISYVSLAVDREAPEIQIEVVPEYQGLGFGFEMLERGICMAFEEFGISQLKYVVNPANVSSIALIEKLGGVLQVPKTYAEAMLLKTYRLERR